MRYHRSFSRLRIGAGSMAARAKFLALTAAARVHGVRLGVVIDTTNGRHPVVTDGRPDGTRRTAVFLTPDRSFIDLYFPAPDGPSEEHVHPADGMRMFISFREGLSLLFAATRSLHGCRIAPNPSR